MSHSNAFNQLVISRTLKWITEVVVQCNFCPFAAREVKRNSIHYEVAPALTKAAALDLFLQCCRQLDNDKNIETALLIFPHSFQRFPDYLKLLDAVNSSIKRNGYEGVYQVASFHPDYFFAGAPMDDPANFTNRSVYPMLHLLREEGIERALEHFPDPGSIPEKNIEFARKKGFAYMKALRDSCL